MPRPGRSLFRLLGLRNSRPVVAIYEPLAERLLHSWAIPRRMLASPSLIALTKRWHTATHQPLRIWTHCATRPSRSYGSTPSKPKIKSVTALAAPQRRDKTRKRDAGSGPARGEKRGRGGGGARPGGGALALSLDPSFSPQTPLQMALLRPASDDVRRSA